MGRLSLRKYLPAFAFGARCEEQNLSDEVIDQLRAMTGDHVDGSITPEMLDRSYVEASFGADADGQPPGTIRKIIRMWIQDAKLFGESDDEF